MNETLSAGIVRLIAGGLVLGMLGAVATWRQSKRFGLTIAIGGPIHLDRLTVAGLWGMAILLLWGLAIATRLLK